MKAILLALLPTATVVVLFLRSATPVRAPSRREAVQEWPDLVPVAERAAPTPTPEEPAFERAPRSVLHGCVRGPTGGVRGVRVVAREGDGNRILAETGTGPDGGYALELPESAEGPEVDLEDRDGPALRDHASCAVASATGS